MELRHVVAATDQSAAGHHAVLVAARLAEQAGARLTVLSVRLATPTQGEPATTPSDTEHQTLLRDLSRSLESELRREAPGVAPAFTVLSGVPGVEIPRYAEEHAGDLLILGRKQRTQRQRMFLGDTADAVARRSQVPCLFVGVECVELGPMLVCLDATDRSVSVFQTAADFSRTIEMPLRAVTVEPVWLNEPDELAAALPASRTLRLNRTLDRGVVTTELRIRRGNVLTELLTEAADTGAKLMAFGYHRGGPPGIVEGGSVARGLLHSALCAVLTVPL
ncbi:MAG: universal stress protein [Gemmatimonadales bacterium]|jgi:nucleotide-binding universal stress UspA family protein|nr:MAG: universal stress protein [Gemmatimonadales bacterium]